MTSHRPEIPIRESCGVCGKISRVGFWVPDEIWREAVHPHYIHSPHCLECFTARADDKLLPWHEEIVFQPYSMVKHLETIEEARKWHSQEG